MGVRATCLNIDELMTTNPRTNFYAAATILMNCAAE